MSLVMPSTSTRRLAAATLAGAILATPARADPAAIAGFWAIGSAPDDRSCDLEFLPAIAYEFEGVWHVARPLHYEDNRAACHGIGIDDVVAWSVPENGGLIWLLAEGTAGLMEFAGDGDRLTMVRSGHQAPPRLLLEKLPGLPVD